MWTKNISLLRNFNMALADLFFQEHGVLPSISSRGNKFFLEGYIHDVWFCDDDLTLKARCYHSQKKTLKPHNLSFKFDKDPLRIIESHCSCEVGLSSSCHHLVGLAFYLNDHLLHGELTLRETASTSLEKQWNKPRGTKVLPENIMTTIFSNPSKVNRKKDPVIPKLKVPGVSTEGSSGRRKFQTHLANIAPNLPICYILDYDSDELTEEMTYAALQPVQSQTDELILQDRNRYLELPILASHTTNILISIAPPDVPEVTFENSLSLELNTRGQREIPLWFKERRRRFTSSNFGMLCKRKKDVTIEFFENLWKDTNLDNVQAIQHGRKEEANALNMYTAHSGNTVRRCGLVVHPYAPHLGTSPDGVVITPNGDIGVVEVKCPLTKKVCNMQQFMSLKTSHLMEDENKVICLKQNHNYYYQAQGQMLLTGARWCDFVTYIAYLNHLEVVRVEFDEEFCVSMYAKLTNMYNIFLNLYN